MSGEALATLIRPRQPDDGQGLAQVWLDTARYYVKLDPERFQAPDAHGLETWFEEGLAQARGDDQFDRVADVDGQVVGLVHAVIMEPIESAPRQLLRELAWRRLMVNALVADGQRHMQADQVGDGVAELERAARLLPERPEAWALLAQLATSVKP